MLKLKNILDLTIFSNCCKVTSVRNECGGVNYSYTLQNQDSDMAQDWKVRLQCTLTRDDIINLVTRSLYITQTRKWFLMTSMTMKNGNTILLQWSGLIKTNEVVRVIHTHVKKVTILWRLSSTIGTIEILIEKHFNY